MNIDILLGASSAATQIEGGGFSHSWSDWYEKGRIHDGSNPARANELYSLLKRPIYITENGTCDNNDTFHCRFLHDHLEALITSDLPVERYYHWSFTDNFEWCEGESARFGLVHIDYPTQKRTVKKSGRFYTAMIKNKSITSEMFDEFVSRQEYHL